MDLIIQFKVFSTQKLRVDFEKQKQIQREIKEALTKYYEEYEETYNQIYSGSINLFITEVDQNEANWLVYFTEQNEIEKLAHIDRISKEVRMSTYEYYTAEKEEDVRPPSP
ncbi:hypothetical protein [Legionella micdadei]|uniref:Uncharacterized protein n=1 Tax=Legionella micdadei TaxID=451 RepID=A0A098GBK5_LEGMI|nr:hypothetical protein [Legionella micdadei]ARG98434.1 hypothetical protein B6N58_12640 [Legionella micdadei]ARH01180.1 hypothetical protein B6V88_12645 [Legionella micdadei]KTD30355.1 hypothetical protein Lmic_0106 [Legionella micdadei]NSL18369.1 hypothetical protein [Legionella micdadei]CEG59878.1 protein of unknown function [Legionella micdadei]